MKAPTFVIALLTCTTSLQAAEAEAPSVSAGELAGRMASRQEGSAQVRVRLETAGSTLQLLIKERRSRGSTDLAYQVLFPKERKGEGLLLQQSGGRASGILVSPGNKPRTLGGAQMSESLFGSDLSYQDVLENFYSWDNQTITGTEVVNRVPCQILESKPGKGERSPYASVRSWVDARRLVPMRVEKYGEGGRLVRRIDTTRVVSQDGRSLPANLTISDMKGPVTELDGSSIKRDVAFTDRDFSPEGFAEPAARSAKEE